jgi:cytochrome c oxidase subunit I+III
MPVTCLYTMGAMAVLLLGMFNGFVAQTLPVRLTADSPLLAAARLHYVLVGTSVLLVVALLYQRVAGARPESDDTLGRLSFWLVFLGFNAAFFPTALRRAPMLLSDPAAIVSGSAGPVVFLGALSFAVGLVVCLWDLGRAFTMRIGEGGLLD